jgi:hypothetical protein
MVTTQMNKLTKQLIFSSLVLLLTLEVVAYPAFSLTTHNGSSGVTDCSVSQNVSPTAVAHVFQKGMSYSCWSNDDYSTSVSDESLRLLAETGTEWIALCFSWVQSNTTSHDIQLRSSGTPTPESLEHAITTAHSLGLKVMLKPMVEARERQGSLPYPVWRGEIQPSVEWFANYSSFINFFAAFAEENGVEMLSVGCEYTATTGEKEQWETVIQGVRERYSGPIVYAADWTNYKNIEWWSSVDYVGIDAYFHLSILKPDPSFDELKNAWNSYAAEIEAWLTTVNKPVIFTEIGYRSGDGTNMAPSNYWSDMTVDLQEQQDCYEAAFQALWNKNWFQGFYWWTWVFDHNVGGPNDSAHTPQNKPAQTVITNWYSKDRKIAIIDQTFTSTKKCGIKEAQTVGFHVSWESNGDDVTDGIVYVNGNEYVTNSTGWVSFSVSYEDVGERSWAVTDFSHVDASGYRVPVASASIVWDKITVNVNVDSSWFGQSKVKVQVVQLYDGASVTDATTVVNGKVCTETATGIYETSIPSWSPLQQVTVQTDTTDLPPETWTTSTFHALNTGLYLTLIAAIVTTVLLLKRLRYSPNQTTA